jgi:superfamily II DNA or RNA helicase
VVRAVGRRLSIEEIEELLNETLFDHQRDPVSVAQVQDPDKVRQCLYYRTGSGKTITALSVLAAAGVDSALVVAPPTTAPAWEALAGTLGIGVRVVSHAKFRMPDFKLHKDAAIVADEFHMFGGVQAAGWRKLERAARTLKAPVLLLSATPNYNDAERVYCVQRILDPLGTAGGFLQFLYTHCNTQENPFGRIPLVDSLKKYETAEEFLAALPDVYYLPETTNVVIHDEHLFWNPPQSWTEYGLRDDTKRIFASYMEERHLLERRQRVHLDGSLRPNYLSCLVTLLGGRKPALVFCASSRIAEATLHGLRLNYPSWSAKLVTGTTSNREKLQTLDEFRSSGIDILVGTATLATGTDGLDRVCDTLIIAHDTDDDALRRQLIGRILPRGDANPKLLSRKRVYRILFSS